MIFPHYVKKMLLVISFETKKGKDDNFGCIDLIHEMVENLPNL